jgi:hypothetical protein
MDESLVCECGNEEFWFFWSYARCTKCFNEYKREWRDSWTTGFGGGGGHNESMPEHWMRRFNKVKNQYHDNWERSKITYKK